jgi:uncharacterized membrane protein
MLWLIKLFGVSLAFGWLCWAIVAVTSEETRKRREKSHRLADNHVSNR